MKECPICTADIYPHCGTDPRSRLYSPNCDLVKCEVCLNVGTLDGRYWPKADERNHLVFTELLNTLNQLRHDIEETEESREQQ